MSPRSINLRDLLAQHTTAAAPELLRQEADNSLRCLACGHRCRLRPGRHGACHVRFNDNGQLRVPWGYVSSLAADPIEKKPFYHAYPGSAALSFGMFGCNFHCPFCQNWVTSQTLRDSHALANPQLIDAERIVRLALEHECRTLSSTYNEPLITAEWAVEVFKLGQPHGLIGSFVSNGHATPEALEFLRPHVRLLNIDLKAWQEASYRQLGGVLDRVLDTIRRAHALGFWIEVATLVVPGWNDSDDELRQIADFVAGVSPDIPWHVTAFHPTYKMTTPSRTPADALLRAYDAGRAAGLKFIYAGNLPGSVGNHENTYCPACNELLIERSGFYVRQVRLRNGTCPACGEHIPGVWQ
jgi:pyruvate formate lyase activating enzyme